MPEESAIKVVMRVKPTKKPSGYWELDQTTKTIVWKVEKNESAGYVNNSKTRSVIKFNDLLDMSISQEAVFERVAKECIDNAIKGYNSTIFAYGQTGSGKTFTITGGADNYEDRGIIPRTINYIFQQFEKSDVEYQISISFLEIYNDSGYDLLSKEHETSETISAIPKVILREDEDGNIHVSNLEMHKVSSEEEALNLLFLGDTNRAVSSTVMNLVSSRSHCIFTIGIESRVSGSSLVKRSKLNLVDLAGSERVHKTNSSGQTLLEAEYINLSLHYLELVIDALSKKESYIPYRNSMLTSILRDSLGGNCKTVMIATISGEKEQTDESISTCKFAQRVAKIKNMATLNEEQDPFIVIQRLKAQVRDMEAELAMLKGEANEGFELTPDELEDLKRRLKCYIDSTDIPPILDLGEFTFMRIRKGFEIMRNYVIEAGKNGGGIAGNGGIIGQSNSDLQNKINDLEQQLIQRDTEINVLVDMVKKNQRMTPVTPNSTISSSSASSTTTNQDFKSNNTIKPVNGKVPGYYGPGGDIVDKSYINNKDDAYKIFKFTYPSIKSMDKNKIELKSRFEEAQKIGSEVNNARQEIQLLKKKIEQIREFKSMSSSGLVDTKGPEEEEEQKELENLERNKKIYEEGFKKLKAAKLEIEHIKHIVENQEQECKVNFEKWFSQLQKYYNSSVMQNSKQKVVQSTNMNNNNNTPLTTKTESFTKTNNSSVSDSKSSNVDDSIAEFNRASQELLRRFKGKKSLEKYE